MSKIASFFEKFFIGFTVLLALLVVFAAVWIFVLDTRVKPPEWLPKNVEESIRRALPDFFTYRPGEEPPPPPKQKGYIELPQIEVAILGENKQAVQKIIFKSIAVLDDISDESTYEGFVFSLMRDAMVREASVAVQRPIAILPSGHFNTPYLEKRLRKALLEIFPEDILLHVKILVLRQSAIIRNNR